MDIGSNHAVVANNTCFFDKLGWEGICIEVDSTFNSTYTHAGRTCTFINADATILDWKSVIESNNLDIKYSKNIDYLSLDIDQMSTNVLLKLPMNEYKFKVITIEHDFYIYGEQYKSEQKKYLSEMGYLLLCENVCVEQPGLFYGHPWNVNPLPFEDWWIHPEFFSDETIERLSCTNTHPSQIISKFLQQREG